MLKRLISFFALIAVWAFNVHGFEVDGLRYEINSDGTSVTVYGTGNSGAVVIPESVEDSSGNSYSVTSIGTMAFLNCVGLTSVSIPNSVETIGAGAFYGCSGLTGALTIPKSVSSVGASAFEDCEGLTSVNWNAKNCPDFASNTAPFQDLTGITSFNIGNEVEKIPANLCYGLSGLKSVTIPNSVTSIGGGAFSGCSGLKSLTIPNSVTSIGEKIVVNSNNKLSVYWNANIQVECKALMDSNIKSITFGNEVEVIPGSLCEGCHNLTFLTIPNSVTSIGSGAFKGCGLISVTIPNSVTSIGNSAFNGCSGLTTATIGNSVTEIGKYAFENCSGLTKVEISDLVAWCNISFGDRWANPLYYAHHLYMNGSEIKDLVIPSTITTIKACAFCGCSGLTGPLTIPNSVTEIGLWAFYDCSGLTSVTIGNPYTVIGGEAFNGTAWYNSQPNGVVYAGNTAYSYKGTLPSGSHIDIKEGTTRINDRLFFNMPGLTSISVPKSVIYIGPEAFTSTTFFNNIPEPSIVVLGSVAYRLKGSVNYYFYIDLSDNIVTIGDDFCSEQQKLTSISFPNSLKYIGRRAFEGCGALSSVTIPNSVSEIGSYAFKGCSGLTSVTIPKSVTTINVGLFSGCSKLTSIEIPNSVTSIGGGAFHSCSGLTSVTIPNSVTSIGNSAFYGCSGLTRIDSYPNPDNVLLGYDVFLGVPKDKCTLHVGTELYEAYSTAEQWKEFFNIVADINGVEGVEVDAATKEVEGYYNLQGIRLNEPARGQVNIVRYTDGTAKKIIVK